MVDDTSAALQALIQQLTTLTETVQAQEKRMNDLRTMNQRLLDDKMDQKRKQAARTSNMTEDQMQSLINMGFERGDDGNWYPKGANQTHQLSREDARDPEKYRAAKMAAEAAGKTLQVVGEDNRDSTIRNTPDGSKPKTDASLKPISIDDTHYRVRWVRRDHNTDAGLVQRRMAAEREGFTVKVWDTAEDLPQNVQTKLALMERAHDAEET